MKYAQGATSIHINDKRQVYSCFPIVFIRPDNTDAQLRKTIRHEIIHYFLALHYYNHEDNSALFTLICNLFDGGAYETLSNKGQIVYDCAKTYPEYLGMAECSKILEAQTSKVNSERKVSVLNTALFVLLDYYGNQRGFYDSIMTKETSSGAAEQRTKSLQEV